MYYVRNYATALLAMLLVLVGAPPAMAEVIEGNPLRIFMDATGRLQVRFAGAAAAELKPASSDLAGRSGMYLNVYIGSGASFPCGPPGLGNPFTPMSGPTAVTGSGTLASPLQMSTTYSCGSLVITQTFLYVNGDPDFVARYAITNTSATEAVMFRALSRGAFTAAGTGRGQGFVDQTAPRIVGMFNDAQGSAGGYVEAASTPWSRFLEGPDLYPSSFDGGESDISGAGLNNTVDPSPALDPRVVVQFDDYRSAGLPAGASDTFDVRWFFDRYDGLALAPASATATVGQSQSVTATSLNHGEPVSGGTVRYSISGANPASGSLLLSAAGSAAIAWTGANAGSDTLTAYIDSDGNGSFDPGAETQASATVTWTAAPSPPAPPLPPPPPVVPASLAQPGCPVTGKVIRGRSGADNRSGTRASDIIFGLGGNDVLRGAAGDDCLYGGPGADRLFGDAGADRLFGGAGRDRLSGGPGNDRLQGDAGADRLVDHRGRDAFSGGAGDDEIDARDDSPLERRRRDDVACGAGRRDVARVDRRDRVARDCERVRRR